MGYRGKRHWITSHKLGPKGHKLSPYMEYICSKSRKEFHRFTYRDDDLEYDDHYTDCGCMDCHNIEDYID